MAISDWSTTASSNGNSDSNINWAEGQAPSTVNDSARSMMSRLKHWWNQLGANTTQGGASNAYTITSGESLSAYANGMRFLWQPNADPTGAVTLNVDAIGAKKVYLPDGNQAGSGDLDADSMYDVVYDTALDSAAGGFKIVGFPDATVTGSVYVPGGTDVALADGGTGTSLADPNADRILFWDDSAGAMTWLAPSTGLTISGTNLTVDSTVWTSANDGAGSGLDADTLDGVEASALAQLSAANTFTGAPQTISGGAPRLALYETDAGTDEKYWTMDASGSAFRIRALTDALGGTSFPMVITRSGTTVAAVQFNATTLDVNANADISGDMTAGTITAQVNVSSETTGTLTSASANKQVQLTGNPTINNNVFSAGDMIIMYAGAASRTITAGTITTMRLDGTSTTGSRTLAARGLAVLFFVSATEVVVSGGAVS